MMTEILTALIGVLTGGGVTGIFAWRAMRRKAEGEATQTEAEAMKSVQDVYQQALADQQNYIDKLKETRNQLIDDREEMRRENNELRNRLNDMEGKVMELDQKVARNGRMMVALRPFLCGRIDCPSRTVVEIGSNEDIVHTVSTPGKRAPEKTNS